VVSGRPFEEEEEELALFAANASNYAESQGIIKQPPPFFAGKKQNSLKSFRGNKEVTAIRS
jgi:hypothetical protein